jgi:hypothetical protein
MGPLAVAQSHPANKQWSGFSSQILTWFDHHAHILPPYQLFLNFDLLILWALGSSSNLQHRL